MKRLRLPLLFSFLSIAFCIWATTKATSDHLLIADNMEPVKNVLGTALESCCTDPMTGFYRDGSCHTGPNDYGVHVVCAVMTQAFLDYTKSCGNDLCTPAPQYNFPGLKPGDKWCLCATRWRDALKAGKAPKIILASTHERMLRHVPLEVLKKHAVDKGKIY